MFRSISWRRLCPDVVSSRIDEALSSRFYILHQTGPTGFVLKGEQSSRKFKVCLGDPNMCSCAEFKKSHELCHHILWILLKKFRVPRDNPLVWQLALVEREIDEIILGYLRRQPADQPQCSNQSHDHQQLVEQRVIAPDDVCPICQDNLLDSAQSLVYCRFGCGQSIHTKCMKIMADHQRSVGGERPVLCPLCREEFGPIQSGTSKSAKRLRAERESLHLGVTCSHCHVCPVAGKCYRCATCISYHLCHACFSSNQIHLLHPFQYRKHSNQPWRPATRSTALPPSDSPALPPALVSTLQSRSLTESDYELLLQLDIPSSSHAHSPGGSGVSPASHMTNHVTGVPERVINTLHVEPLDGNHPLIVGGASCQLCRGQYRRGDWVRKLPCKHKFHRDCLQDWLRTNSVCPIDGRSVCSQTTRNKRRLARQTRDSARSHRVIPLTRALTENPVRGQSSRVNGHQSELDEGVTFTVSGQHISGCGQSGGVCLSGGRRCSKRLVLDCETLPLPLGHPLSETTLPLITASPLTGHSDPAMSRSRRQLSVSIPSGDSPSPSTVTVSLAPTITRCAQSLSQASPVMSHDHSQYGRGLQEYPSKGPVHLSKGRPCVCEESRTLSLPSLGAAGMRSGGAGEGRLMKGSSLAHKRKSTAPTVQDCSELDTSLQVSSFKLCPLSLTHSLVTTSAGL